MGHCGSLAAWTRTWFPGSLSGERWRAARATGRSGSAPSRVWARWRTPPGSRCATSSYAGSRCRCSRPGHRPLKVLHVSDLHLTPTRAGSGAGWPRSPTSSPTWWSTPATTSRTRTRSARCVEGFGPLLDVPGVFVFGSNDYFAPTLRNPLWYLLPDDGQRNTHTPKLPWRGPARRLREARLDRPDQHLGAARGRRHHARLRRRRRPAPRVRRPRRRRRAGPGRRRPAHRRRARAVPPGARPVRPRRLRPHLRRPHPRRPGLPARSRARSSPTATSTPGAPRACTGTRPTPGRATRGAPGCTSRRAPAPRRTPRSGCAAGPRRPC